MERITRYKSTADNYIEITSNTGWSILPGNTSEWYLTFANGLVTKKLNFDEGDIQVLIRLLEALDMELNNTENKECPF